MKRIVLLAGFETFNAGLYRQAAERAMALCPQLAIQVFSDRDLGERPEAVATALAGADAFFASLIFDFDQVEWLRQQAAAVPIRLVFESALELMALTCFGRFTLGGSSAGMPRPIQALLAKFGSGREEDKLAGYIGFLKVGPRLLRFLPSRRAQDLRHWLILYSYWNAGGRENVVALFLYLARHGLGLRPGTIPPLRQSPDLGLVHPDHDGYFLSPCEYLAWFQHTRPQAAPGQGNWPVVGLLLYRKHVLTDQPYIPQLIRAFEAACLVPLPMFINGVEGHMAVRDWMTSATERATEQAAEQKAHGAHRDAVAVDAIVSTIGFPLVGGPAGSMEAGRREQVAQRILRAKNVPYVVAAPLLIQDLHSWTRQGIGGLQSVVLFALPELDGAIDPVPLGGLVGDRIYLIPERLRRLTGRLNAWIALRRKPAAERRLAIVLYGFPPGYGATGTAALLNVPASLMALLQALAAEGYDLGPLPASGEELIRQVKEADDAWIARIPAGERFEDSVSVTTVSVETLRHWLGPLHTARIEKQWGPLGDTGIRTLGDRFLLGGVRLGKVWIGVQPPLGVAGDPMRLMYERDLTPHPQYAAFYGWLQHGLQADVVLHFGMHGTVEWLPGSPLGNTGYSWPDLLLGHLPHLYVYAANNPSESMLAKRRGYGVIVSHNVPPYGRAGLYRELIALRDLMAEYREDPERNAALSEGILKQVSDSGLDADCPAPENARADREAFDSWVVRLSSYLQLLENRLFSSGLHTLGQPPDQEQRLAYLKAYVGPALPEALLEAISLMTPASDEPGLRTQAAELERLHPSPFKAGTGEGVDRSQGAIPADATEAVDPSQRPISPGEVEGAERSQRLLDALRVCQLLERCTEEIDHLLAGLDGQYIPPAPGGDLLRDGPGVLPTGRNIHALDPYRMPSPGALVRGREIARRILEQHRAENGGAWPDTVAVMLWGLDAIKTRGESLAILLELVGAEPVQESTGRIVRYDLKPLESLGHPRIDVLVNLSGIFRDSFVNIVELLDDLFRRAAAADEPPERNAIRRHAQQLAAEGIANPSARLFSNPAGDFGSLVNDRVTDANWESGEELAGTWQGRNVYSYGRADKGEARPQVLAALLRSTDRVVQQIDSVEYGLTDIQEYYANTGGLKRAAEVAQQSIRPGGRVAASFVESFSRDTTPRDLEELLRLEYRTKLLNPRWAKAMAAMGSGGAYEISQRMTALIGWGGTSGFRDPWVYDQAADTYAFDPAMAQRLREANPEAFRNVVGRMLEANSRGLWNAPAEKIDRLRNLYDLTDAELEGVTVAAESS